MDSEKHKSIERSATKNILLFVICSVAIGVVMAFMVSTVWANVPRWMQIIACALFGAIIAAAIFRKKYMN